MTLGIRGPQFSEEEHHSMAMPDSPELRCDACSIVALGMAGALLHAESMRGRPLKQHQVDSALEHVCEEGLREYEVTEIDGKARFDVPGAFKPKENAPIMKSSGEIWSHRLKAACREVLGDLGEEELYLRLRRAVPTPPAKGRPPDPGLSSAGAEVFVRGLCELPGDREDAGSKAGKRGKGKAGRKPKRAASLAGTCPTSLLFFSREGWSEVMALWAKHRGKIEL